MRRNNTRRFN